MNQFHHMPHWFKKCLADHCIHAVDHFYTGLFSVLEQTHRALSICDSKWVTSFVQRVFEYIHSSGVYSAVWCVMADARTFVEYTKFGSRGILGGHKTRHAINSHSSMWWPSLIMNECLTWLSIWGWGWYSSSVASTLSACTIQPRMSPRLIGKQNCTMLIELMRKVKKYKQFRNVKGTRTSALEVAECMPLSLWKYSNSAFQCMPQ